MKRFRETNIWWIRLCVSFWLKFDLPRFIRSKGWNRARIWQLFIPASPTRFRALFVVRCPLFSGSKHARAWRLCARDDIYENRAVCTSPYRLAFSAIYQPRRPNKSRALSRYPWHDTVDNRSRGEREGWTLRLFRKSCQARMLGFHIHHEHFVARGFSSNPLWRDPWNFKSAEKRPWTFDVVADLNRCLKYILFEDRCDLKWLCALDLILDIPSRYRGGFLFD